MLVYYNTKKPYITYLDLILYSLLVSLGVHIIDLRKTWEKLLMAARIIAAIENPADVCVLSARPYGQVSFNCLIEPGISSYFL